MQSPKQRIYNTGPAEGGVLLQPGHQRHTALLSDAVAPQLQRHQRVVALQSGAQRSAAAVADFREVQFRGAMQHTDALMHKGSVTNMGLCDLCVLRISGSTMVVMFEGLIKADTIIKADKSTPSEITEYGL